MDTIKQRFVINSDQSLIILPYLRDEGHSTKEKRYNLEAASQLQRAEAESRH
jgi:hypothetical protein